MANRLNDFCISGTPADVTGKGFSSGFFIGRWVAFKQSISGHEHAWGAEPALDSAVINEGLLKI
jgi:hypothetical protein